MYLRKVEEIELKQAEHLVGLALKIKRIPLSSVKLTFDWVILLKYLDENSSVKLKFELDLTWVMLLKYYVPWDLNLLIVSFEYEQ